MRSPFFFCIYLCWSWSIGQNLPYNLTKPDRVFKLPAVLQEVSGITYIDSTTIACIQDENGTVFFYDLNKGEIKRELAFAYQGDFEGITRIDKKLVVLRSDGALFEIPDYTAAEANTKHHLNQVPARNNEGLCFDHRGSRLLLASKGKVDGEEKSKRIVYELELKSGQFNPKVAYRFDVIKLTEFAADKGIIERYRLTPKGKSVPNFLKVRFSEIAVHPLTDELYLLSADDHMLFVFNRKGKLTELVKLDKAMFNKAEGLTFFPNGDMLISNEGEKDEPTLLLFRMPAAERN